MINSSPKFGKAYIAKPPNADTRNLKILNLAVESGSSEISRKPNIRRLVESEAQALKICSAPYLKVTETNPSRILSETLDIAHIC